MSNEPRPRFTGIFIPVEILERDDISLLEKLLLSWIDALFCKEHGGCFASNAYLGEKLRVEPNTIAKSLTCLRKLGLIEDVSFEGGKRIIRALLGKAVEESQSKRVGEKSKGGWIKIQGGLDKNPSAHIYNIKEERKESSSGDGSTAPIPSSPSKKKSKLIEVAPKTLITQNHIDTLKQKYGDEMYEKMIKFYSDWKVRTGYSKRSDYKCMINWVPETIKNEEQKTANTESSIEKNLKGLEEIWSYLVRIGARGDLRWSADNPLVTDVVLNRTANLSSPKLLPMVAAWYAIPWEDEGGN